MRNRAQLLILLASTAVPAAAQQPITAADYERARGLQSRYTSSLIDVIETPTWTGNARFWYRKSVAGGHAFVLVDASNPDAPAKRPAFDHARLASGLAAAAGRTYTAVTLPFTTFTFTSGDQGITFAAENAAWSCALTSYSCQRTAGGGGRGAGGGRGGGRGGGGGAAPAAADEGVTSPDGRRIAYIRNYNVWVRDAGSGPEVGRALSRDGSEGNPFTRQSLQWSPNSRYLAAYRVRPGYQRMVRYVVSSPPDQVQPSYFERFYAKPGDVLDLQQPTLFDVDSGRQTNVDNALFPHPFDLTRLQWLRDSRAFTFEYNERGHQRYRVIEVNAATGAARALIDESARTFIDYRRASGTLDGGGRVWRADVNDGAEIIWLSERDGWAHLYLYDGATGRVKHQITKGSFVVRTVQRVDEAGRQIYFSAGGMDPRQDPYYAQYYRVNFDGTGLTPLTEAPADHQVTFSPDGALYVDKWSRVDLAPVAQLRRASDGKVLMELETGDVSALTRAGWRPLEVFTAKGRDGVTDIWGVVARPSRFDARRRYPVIEYIYAGPHGSFVPKGFVAWNNMMAIAELGFVVVQIDGMGTANRSRAFHDVAWKNIGDAGFPDRILWHRAYAARHAWYDTTRVGIFGGSAGGQNALGGLLFHPGFYKVAVSFAGCHDNRMDKIWWNEQWMGWPIGPEYEASSNVVHAHKLQGRLLLVVPELDTNVDPASTMQVVNALIRADKSFDLLVMPNEEHGGGRRGPSAAYGDRKMWDFFVQHLLGMSPPHWNAMPAAARAVDDDGSDAASAFGPSWEAVRATFERKP
ncbi:MAG TPA: prolyl oligopeptidase family serine peptidase [Gemmatimonadaceae bacterium]|nr:prolyl oligopeptidase family serine peptidase [Gemmatimonadaceae bacterium]